MVNTTFDYNGKRYQPMDYPHIPPHLRKEEIIEHFTVTREERFFLPKWRKPHNILGFAVLLKAFLFLGFPPRSKEDVPMPVVSWIAQQLRLEPSEFDKYQWKNRWWDKHLARIRTFTGFDVFREKDAQALAQWLIDEAQNHPSRSKMFAAAINRCRRLRLELPKEKEFRRLVHSAWQQYLDITCRIISGRLSPNIRKRIDTCLDVDPSDPERYDWMKDKPGKFGVKTLLGEIGRLRFVNTFEIRPDFHLLGVPDEVLRILRERALPEDAYQMKRHPEDIVTL